jgi:hypothetical protein
MNIMVTKKVKPGPKPVAKAAKVVKTVQSTKAELTGANGVTREPSAPLVTEVAKPVKVKVAKPAVALTGRAAQIADGLSNFKLAGKPTVNQLIAVYGKTGANGNWAERAAMGVSAAQFQKALADGVCVAKVAKVKEQPIVPHVVKPTTDTFTDAERKLMSS